MKNKNIFKKIAKRNHTTEAVVRKEIAVAIKEARNFPDPEAQRFWRTVGEDTSLEEIVRKLSRQI